MTSKIFRTIVLQVLLFFLVCDVLAQFKPSETFKSVIHPYVNQYRSANGSPGNKYWQNSADYDIQAKLDTVLHQVNGSVTIEYTNNSPDVLSFIWLQLDQNFRKPDSKSMRSRDTFQPNDPATFSDGFEIKALTIKDQHTQYTPEYEINDTRMKVALKRPVPANGAKIRIQITYSFIIPGKSPVRMGRDSTAGGWIYQVAQWYPRMAVYDDLNGWNCQPYIPMTEFYLEYGKFDYSITVPANMIVTGSGELKNPEEVLTRDQRIKLQLAKKSDITVMISDAAANSKSAAATGTKTWRFSCGRSRDIAWGASAGFIWDAAGIKLPGNQECIAMSFYPLENRELWKHATQYSKSVIEFNSRQWYPYPYPAAINIAGTVAGMEYPGLVFCHKNESGESLQGLIAHEFGHIWFPMIVGSNERMHGWMDEGPTTFLTSHYMKTVAGKEYYECDSSCKQYMFGGNATLNPPMISDSYDKPALALRLLRQAVLGEERFDKAFRKYIKDWAFKHPSPWDFFQSINNTAGEDLSWFWNSWFLNSWKLDQAVEDVHYVDKKDFSKGAGITVRNLDKMVMPAVISVTEENGVTRKITIPVETWMYRPSHTFWYPSKSKIIKVMIDPDQLLPDMDRNNNSWMNQ